MNLFTQQKQTHRHSKQTWLSGDTVGETNCKIGIDTGRSVICCVRLFVILWTAAHQAPLSMGISWEEYRSRLPFAPPSNHPDPGIKLMSSVSPALQADSLLLSHQGNPIYIQLYIKYLTNRNLLYNTGNSIQYSVMTCTGKSSF